MESDNDEGENKKRDRRNRKKWNAKMGIKKIKKDKNVKSFCSLNDKN